MNSSNPLLSVKDLVIEFKTEKGWVRAVDQISFDVHAGETIGLVGESGCGKSVTSLSLLGLIPKPPGRYGTESSILFKGKELLRCNESELRKIRGSQISMIFQEPMTALNPVFKISTQMEEVLMRHKKVSRKKAHLIAVEMLETVGIPSPEKRIHQYPHQLSGGMRQRVMIAMALSCDPQLLLADEPTTALDVTIQAQVMEQMAKLQKQRHMATILVTHDLAVIAEFCQKVIVMYCGKIVEIANVHELFYKPRHPYTKGLLDSIPRIRDEKLDRLPTIKGTVPDIAHLPSGCRFYDRCEKAEARCNKQQPLLTPVEKTQVACFNPF